jgi:hypothetical protein
MKKTLIILSLIILSISSYSQNEVEIPKGTNKIILETNLNEKENINLILRVIKENDYLIKKLDTITFQIQTDKRMLGNTQSSYKLNFNILNQIVLVTGYMDTPKYYPNYPDYKNEIRKFGFKNSDGMEIFRKMNELCLKIVSQEKIKYTTKN